MMLSHEHGERALSATALRSSGSCDGPVVRSHYPKPAAPWEARLRLPASFSLRGLGGTATLRDWPVGTQVGPAASTMPVPARRGSHHDGSCRSIAAAAGSGS
jgi:hypothetical protein